MLCKCGALLDYSLPSLCEHVSLHCASNVQSGSLASLLLLVLVETAAYLCRLALHSCCCQSSANCTASRELKKKSRNRNTATKLVVFTFRRNPCNQCAAMTLAVPLRTCPTAILPIFTKVQLSEQILLCDSIWRVLFSASVTQVTEAAPLSTNSQGSGQPQHQKKRTEKRGPRRRYSCLSLTKKIKKIERGKKR